MGYSLHAVDTSCVDAPASKGDFPASFCFLAEYPRRRGCPCDAADSPRWEARSSRAPMALALRLDGSRDRRGCTHHAKNEHWFTAKTVSRSVPQRKEKLETSGTFIANR